MLRKFVSLVGIDSVYLTWTTHSVSVCWVDVAAVPPGTVLSVRTPSTEHVRQRAPKGTLGFTRNLCDQMLRIFCLLFIE